MNIPLEICLRNTTWKMFHGSEFREHLHEWESHFSNLLSAEELYDDLVVQLEAPERLSGEPVEFLEIDDFQELERMIPSTHNDYQLPSEGEPIELGILAFTVVPPIEKVQVAEQSIVLSNIPPEFENKKPLDPGIYFQRN